MRIKFSLVFFVPLLFFFLDATAVCKHNAMMATSHGVRLCVCIYIQYRLLLKGGGCICAPSLRTCGDGGGGIVMRSALEHVSLID